MGDIFFLVISPFFIAPTLFIHLHLKLLHFILHTLCHCGQLVAGVSHFVHSGALLLGGGRDVLGLIFELAALDLEVGHGVQDVLATVLHHPPL